MLIEAPFNHLTGSIIATAIEVHRIVGPGMLESTSMACLQYELSARKRRFVAQQTLPLVYKGMALDASYRIDLVVEDTVVVEVKSVRLRAPVSPCETVSSITSARPTGVSRAASERSFSPWTPHR